MQIKLRWLQIRVFLIKVTAYENGAWWVHLIWVAVFPN
jgi:hypothetical protein